MIFMSESCTWYVRHIATSVIFTATLGVPIVAVSDEITILKDGPKTAYEGEVVEYSIETVNTGTTIIEGGKVIDTLPAMVEFIEATPTPGGSYDPVSGIWDLPTLGIGKDDNSAGLRIQALVRPNLIPDPTEFVTATNRAEVIAPVLPVPTIAEVSTNIVCAFCIDWEIVSIELGSDYRLEPPDPFQSRFFLYVQVANNGPVVSEATLGVTHFSISGGGFDSVMLAPTLPVPVSLDVGELEMIAFSTDWEDGPDSDYTISWEFQISDISLIDPVLPNTAAGSWSGEVKDGGSGGGGGCSINNAAARDPVWLFMLILPGIFYIRRNIHSTSRSYVVVM